MSDVHTLSLCLLGLALPVLALGGLLCRSPRAAKWLHAAPFALAAVSAVFAWSLGIWLAPLVLAVLAVLFLATGSAAVGGLLGRIRGALSRTQVKWGVLFAAGPLLLAAWVCWGQADQPPPWQDAPPDILAGHTPASLRPVKVSQALTDAGKQVPLYRVTAHPPAAELAQYEQRLVKNMAGDVIATHAGDPDGNCHGWVFTGGRFWVQSEDVDPILKDNGYRAVKSPRAGDLVVYREFDGKVVHTGMVRFVDEEGQTLVESKWGVGGRFLHPADRHAYSGTTPSFYRSARPGHHLQGIEGPSPSSPRLAPAVAQGPTRDRDSESEAIAAAEAHGTTDEADAD